MEKVEDDLVRSLPVQLPEMRATNGGTINITIIVSVDREPDSLRKFAEQIAREKGEECV